VSLDHKWATPPGLAAGRCLGLVLAMIAKPRPMPALVDWHRRASGVCSRLCPGAPSSACRKAEVAAIPASKSVSPIQHQGTDPLPPREKIITFLFRILPPGGTAPGAVAALSLCRSVVSASFGLPKGSDNQSVLSPMRPPLCMTAKRERDWIDAKAVDIESCERLLRLGLIPHR
jgi:hypothetical protein